MELVTCSISVTAHSYYRVMKGERPSELVPNYLLITAVADQLVLVYVEGLTSA